MIEGPARIVLEDGARGSFYAERAWLDGSVVTARGEFRRDVNGTTERRPAIRTWPMTEIREIRWQTEEDRT